MASQTLLLRETRKEVDRRRHGGTKASSSSSSSHKLFSSPKIHWWGIGWGKLKGVTCHYSGWRGKGGSGWMGEDQGGGGSHTSQGDCELISTLEKGREGGKESEKKESGEAERWRMAMRREGVEKAGCRSRALKPGGGKNTAIGREEWGKAAEEVWTLIFSG